MLLLHGAHLTSWIPAGGEEQLYLSPKSSFATGQAKYQTEQEDLQVAEKTLKTLDAPISQVFPITDSGVYVVELFARDKLGRVQTLSADLYIGGNTPQSWQKSRDGVFEVKSTHGDTNQFIAALQWFPGRSRQ